MSTDSSGPRLPLGAVALSVLISCSLSACWFVKKEFVDRDATESVMITRSIDHGDCHFTLEQAGLVHLDKWEGGVELRAKNAGSDEVDCGFKVKVAMPDGLVVSDTGHVSKKVGPGQEVVLYEDAREHYGIDADPFDAWLWVQLITANGLDTKEIEIIEPEARRPAPSTN